MSEAVQYVLFFIALMAIILFGAEFAGHTVYNTKANEISEYAVSLAEREGEFSPTVIEKVKKKLDDWNMDSGKWKMDYTKGKVDFNQPLNFTIEGKYEYRVFDLLQSGVGVKEVSITSTRSGLSQVYFRS
ncbi:putative secreted protein (plasmid) [Bacillus thuringiensis serovar morrisoni str. 4AA1]|uniref:DUF4320 family protein n=1 Tax=Bacillus TaxID=1386 RepID=UPI0005CEA7CC|nr:MULTISPECIES: DUF4320 family protein [Bacillus]AJQ62748.1 hypothetical protein SD98_31380 [Bacillus thuringiensis serovar morrisoni]MED3102246.1 DUF4320 family protein [Bacillus thuringiensis]MRA99435.1 DUF4320 family protein [Bacillus thuringiensis]OTY44123.1 hypothetical protein BK736_05515 [Bacillus thuringiensis serovar poloniensis]RNG17969.1 DUF4320 family protein [Bacillus thuringiensis]